MISLIPHVTFSGELQPQRKEDNVMKLSVNKANDLVPITSAFQCAFERDMQNFIDVRGLG